MYIPEHFEVSERDKILRFIRGNGFGQLVTIDQKQNRPDSSYLPFLVDDSCSLLTAHMARQNSQWQSLEDQEVLVTFLGPHGYVSPSWYNSPGVPTWNYQVVNVYGRCNTYSDSDRLAKTVRALTENYESDFARPWQADFPVSKLSAIVGIEVQITDIQCKFKLSQNRSKQDQAEVIRQLRATGSEQLAAAMEKNQ